MNTPINDGGPAFPGFAHTPGYGNSRKNEHSGEWEVWKGDMTLRDWFAGHALAGLRARDYMGAGETSRGLNMHHNHATIAHFDNAGKWLARLAYEDADAMLAAREAKQ